MCAVLIFNLKSELPDDDIFPHCYLPLHFWLDKGLVTRRVKKYPMLLQPAWLPRQIKNASGDGGGVLFGYMPVVRLPLPSINAPLYRPAFPAAERQSSQHLRPEAPLRLPKRPELSGKAV